jgi:hypothetical protein
MLISLKQRRYKCAGLKPARVLWREFYPSMLEFSLNLPIKIRIDPDQNTAIPSKNSAYLKTPATTLNKSKKRKRFVLFF